MLAACGLGAMLAACGGSSGPLGAQDILAKPNSADLRDAHFVLSGSIVNGGTTAAVSGDGAVVYRSAPGGGRLTFQSTAAGHPVSVEDLFVNGTDYRLGIPGDGKWVVVTGAPGLGPTSFAGASDFRYLGEDNLPQGLAWHASAKDHSGNVFEGWIRESDGYPLKYTLYASNSAASSTLTLTFDHYNTGVTIIAPPASQLEQP